MIEAKKKEQKDRKRNHDIYRPQNKYQQYFCAR
jgi:hypothetical protein